MEYSELQKLVLFIVIANSILTSRARVIRILYHANSFIEKENRMDQDLSPEYLQNIKNS